MHRACTPRPATAAPLPALAPTYPCPLRNANTAFNRALTKCYDFTHIDRVPQDVFDKVLWHAIHGQASAPPPGPNATPGQ